MYNESMNRPFLSCLMVAALLVGIPPLHAAKAKKKAAAETKKKAAAASTTKKRDKAWLRKLDRWARRIEKIDKKLSKKKLSERRRGKLLRQREKSLAGLDSARKLNQDNHTAQIHMARAFLLIGEFPRARSAAERAVELAPDDLESLSVRALARYKTGAHALAAEDAKRILKKDPNNLGARDILRLTAPASAPKKITPAALSISTAPAPKKESPPLPASTGAPAEKK